MGECAGFVLGFFEREKSLLSESPALAVSFGRAFIRALFWGLEQ